MDCCKSFTLKLDKNDVRRLSSPMNSQCSSPVDSASEDDDLPPNPFSSPNKSNLKQPGDTPPKNNSSLTNVVHFSPSVSINMDTVKKTKFERKRKHDDVKDIRKDLASNVKRVLLHSNDPLIQEHFKKGGIMERRKEVERVTAMPAATVSEQSTEDKSELFNNPPGLSVFVMPLKFVSQLEAPHITNTDSAFEIDLLSAPESILREMVMSNTFLSVFYNKPVPVTIVRWLLTILLMSSDELLSQAAFSVLTCLVHQSHTYSFPAEPFDLSYDDVVKVLEQYGAVRSSDGEDVESNLVSDTDYILSPECKELLLNNLNNFLKYIISLLTAYPRILLSHNLDKMIMLLLKVSLDRHIIDSLLSVTIMQCIGVLLSCYSNQEWCPTKVDQLSQLCLKITDDYCNQCRIVGTIGGLTPRCRQLQKQFARTLLKLKTAVAVSETSSDLDFMVAFVEALYKQEEDYDLDLVYCLLDVLSMYVSPLELCKENDNDLAKLVDCLSQLSSRIHDNPNEPITGFVKDSILRLRNVLQCMPGRQLKQLDMFTFAKTET